MDSSKNANHESDDTLEFLAEQEDVPESNNPNPCQCAIDGEKCGKPVKYQVSLNRTDKNAFEVCDHCIKAYRDANAITQKQGFAIKRL